MVKQCFFLFYVTPFVATSEAPPSLYATVSVKCTGGNSRGLSQSYWLFWSLSPWEFTPGFPGIRVRTKPAPGPLLNGWASTGTARTGPLLDVCQSSHSLLILMPILGEEEKWLKAKAGSCLYPNSPFTMWPWESDNLSESHFIHLLNGDKISSLSVVRFTWGNLGQHL